MTQYDKEYDHFVQHEDLLHPPSPKVHKGSAADKAAHIQCGWTGVNWYHWMFVSAAKSESNESENLERFVFHLPWSALKA